VDWFLSQSSKVNGFSRAIFSGLTTSEFGRFLVSIVCPRNDLFGLLHVASNPISKFDLLSIIANEYNWEGEMVETKEPICDRSLSADLLYSKTGYIPPPWPSMIAEMHTTATQGRQSLETES
jgi:dTDP-4-dehydrorhamnose reductase